MSPTRTPSRLPQLRRPSSTGDGARPQAPSPIVIGMLHSRRAAILLILGYLASNALLPWRALALVPLGWAAVESGRAILAFGREETPAAAAPRGRPAGSGRGAALGRARSGRVTPTRRSAIAWTVMGMVLIGLMMTSVIVPFLFYGSMKSYQDCMLGANTGAASAVCQQRLEGGLTGLLNRATG